ncbi:MAG: hypothetical protein WC356_07640 [Candidatus Micrarchaeia archaeon]|jgi:hypothetical protein
MDIKNKKGQAAMEYLMTYGWALLVIVIVLALLLIILGGYVKGTPSCLFEEAGFVCNEVTPVVKGINGNVYGMFQHSLSEPITILEVAVIQGQSSKDQIHTNCWRTAGGVFGPGYLELAPRQQATFTELVTTNGIGNAIQVCNPSDGSIIASITPGSQIRGQMWIKYNLKSDAAIGFTGNRTVAATLVANVE